MADDHPRISTREVCALARYTPATLWRRIDAGYMPKAIDRGDGGYLFDRRAVLLALGMEPPAEPAPAPEPTWDFDPEAFKIAYARRKARDKGAAWRERPAKVAPGIPAAAPEVVEYPVRMTTREVCELAKFSPSTLWSRLRNGYMPAPIDRGRDGFIFDRQAVVRALGLENVPPAEWATVARNTNDGQNMSDFVRARRQRAYDNLPPRMSYEEALELAKAQIAAEKEQRAKQGRGPS